MSVESTGPAGLADIPDEKPWAFVQAEPSRALDIPDAAFAGHVAAVGKTEGGEYVTLLCDEDGRVKLTEEAMALLREIRDHLDVLRS